MAVTRCIALFDQLPRVVQLLFEQSQLLLALGQHGLSGLTLRLQTLYGLLKRLQIGLQTLLARLKQLPLVIDLLRHKRVAGHRAHHLRLKVDARSARLLRFQATLHGAEPEITLTN